MDYKGICERVCEVAREAGNFIAEQRKEFSFDKVEFKGEHNLVSYVDKGAEKIIVERLTALLPDSGFITEEGTVEQTDRELRWIIDPLDGTTNFVHSLPPYCVSIALMQGREVVVGVVYEVVAGEMFYAWKGSKAYLNGREISVSKVDKLSNSLIALGFAYDSPVEVKNFLRQVEYYQLNTDGIRRIGSAAANLAFVACGRLDAFCQISLHCWDVAAGALIAKAAGAKITDYSGGDDYVFGRQIVVCNEGLYPEFFNSLR